MLLTLALMCCVALPLVAQLAIPGDPATAACGPETKRPKVKNVDNSDVATPSADQATVVYFEDQSTLRPGHDACIGCSVDTQLGMDGKWVAYTKTFSHIIFSVPAGEHHFCAETISTKLIQSSLPAFASLHFDAGKVYYLSSVITPITATSTRLDLLQLNPDEGRFLLSITPRTEVIH